MSNPASKTTDGASIPDQTASGDPWYDDTERARYFDAENKRASVSDATIITMANAYVAACVDARLAQVAGNQTRAVECAKLADAIEDAYPEAADAARAANGARL
jgi:hypothetical protein